MARYFSLKTQEVHEALQEAHNEMGLAKTIPEGATDEVGNQSATGSPGQRRCTCRARQDG